MSKYHDEKRMNELIKKHIAQEGKRRPKSSQTFRVLNAVFKASNEATRRGGK